MRVYESDVATPVKWVERCPLASTLIQYQPHCSCGEFLHFDMPVNHSPVEPLVREMCRVPLSQTRLAFWNFWCTLGTHVCLISLGVTDWFVRHRGLLFRVTTSGVENVIGSIMCFEVFVYELPVAGLMDDYREFALDSASQPDQNLTPDHIESGIRYILP